MISARVTTRGRVTLPRAVRDGLDIVAGDEVEFVEVNGATYIRRKVATSPSARWDYREEMAGDDPNRFIEERQGD